MAMYRMTAARKAALKKAQAASARARKRRGGAKRYSSKRGSYARKVDKMAKSKRRVVRAAAWLQRGDGSNGITGGSAYYRISKARGKKAGKLKKSRKKK
jgi:hypothetical protein